MRSEATRYPLPVTSTLPHHRTFLEWVLATAISTAAFYDRGLPSRSIELKSSSCSRLLLWIVQYHARAGTAVFGGGRPKPGDGYKENWTGVDVQKWRAAIRKVGREWTWGGAEYRMYVMEKNSFLCTLTDLFLTPLSLLLQNIVRPH